MAGHTELYQGKIKALFLAANPARTDHLKIDEEIRAITQKIRAAQHRDLLEVVSVLAVRPDDLQQSLMIHKPQIVHFSAHGSPAGEIILNDINGLPKAVSAIALRELFRVLRDNIRIVILNACYSRLQAEAIREVIDCTIGMNKAIGDRAATTFTASFYGAIGFGRSVQEAFDLGKVALLLEGIRAENVPELLPRAGVDPAQLFIIGSDPSIAKVQDLVKRGQDALLRNNYTAAQRDIERAVDTLDEHSQPELAAKVSFLQALVQLNGQKPLGQTLTTMREIESHLHDALALNRSASYLVILALVKLDFAPNGFSPNQDQAEANRLLYQARQLAWTAQDQENIKLLARCQPILMNDHIRIIQQFLQ